MIYPHDFEEVTGFSQIREMLAGMCRYDSSRQIVSQISLLPSAAEISRSYDEMDEWKKLSELHPSASSAGSTQDITSWLPKLEIENYYFDEEALLVMGSVIEAFASFHKILQKHKEEFPLLTGIIGTPEGHQAVMDIIRSVIDNKGKMLPFASALYGKLGTDIERLEKEARQVTRNLFRQWKEAGFTAETDITVREERLVIPLLAEHKRKVKGFVKDISATGKVIYIEPLESLELNNRLTEMHAEHKRERERILIAATGRLREYRSHLAKAMETLVAVDFIRTRVDLSSKLSANRPQVLNAAVLDLKKALNPLLWLKNKPLKKETVAMDLMLDQEKRIMIISGPNAGGKSISLKTAVLLQYMAQCGLFITAAPESRTGVFLNISVDCGDGQSIEDGLSTFSAHLQHLRKMTSIASGKSLFAIDELGDGTDPRFGGPIAQAILEEMLQSGALGVVTTHYSRLKEWATKTPGVINASMAYDTRELKPLYQLVTGKPGNSFALELMRKTGFEQGMIQRVKELSGEESGKTEDLLMELSARQLELTELVDENAAKQKQLDLLLEEYHTLKEKINSRKKEILDAARQSASELLRDANKQIELTIRTIREHGAQPEKTKNARENLRKFTEKKLIAEDKKSTTENTGQSANKIVKLKPVYRPGMQVRNLLNDSKGEILEVKKDKILAAFGLLKMWVTYDEIEPAEIEKSRSGKKGVTGFNWVQRQSEFKAELDLRGNLAADALQKVQKWMDEAYALGQNHLKIIHGRGDGVLRKTLREYFKKVPYVRSWHSEKEEQGGDGCTIVELS